MTIFSNLFGGKSKKTKETAPNQAILYKTTGERTLLAADVYHFCTLVSKEEDCALLMQMKEYTELLKVMIQNFGEQKNPVDFPFICSKCLTRLDKQITFMMGLMAEQVGLCPKCGNKQAIIVYTSDELYGPVTKRDIQLLKNYFKYLAKLWWRNKNESKKCDDCLHVIGIGQGYIYGSLENNMLQSYRLYCEDCMTKMLDKPEMLSKLKTNPDYIGKDLIKQARDYAKLK